MSVPASCREEVAKLRGNTQLKGQDAACGFSLCISGVGILPQNLNYAAKLETSASESDRRISWQEI